MEKFWSYVGGVVGGYALTQSSLDPISLGAVDPVLDIIGSIVMIVFGVVLIVHSVKSLFGK